MTNPAYPATICRQPPGRFVPVFNRNRCEGKGPCVSACPHAVLAIAPIAPEQRRRLTLVGHVKALVHGGRQAVAADPQRCQACGDCVRVCPEQAITLARWQPVQPASGLGAS